MKFRFEVEVEVERIEGKFAGRDEIEDQIFEWLTNADEGQIDGIGADGSSQYETIDWSVNATEVK